MPRAQFAAAIPCGSIERVSAATRYDPGKRPHVGQPEMTPPSRITMVIAGISNRRMGGENLGGPNFNIAIASTKAIPINTNSDVLLAISQPEAVKRRSRL